MISRKIMKRFHINLHQPILRDMKARKLLKTACSIQQVPQVFILQTTNTLMNTKLLKLS